VESGEAIDHPGRSVGPDADGSSVRGDGEDVGRASQRRHGHPARVRAERDVLRKC
jgi:hypothetical protein